MTLDCFVVSLLAMTLIGAKSPASKRLLNAHKRS
jgi:hypothetical protein